MLRTAIGVGVGLVLGFGLGMFGPWRETTSAAPSPSELSRADSERELAAAPSSRERTPESASIGARSDRAPSEASSITSWLSELGKPELPSGEGEISGRVVQSFAALTPRADLELQLELVADPILPSSELDLESSLRDVARRELARRAATQRVRTGRDGRFHFAGLDSSRRYALTPTAPFSWLARTAGRPLEPLRPSALGDLSIVEYARVELDLITSAGKTPGAAMVEWQNESGLPGAGMGWRPDQRTIDLAVGSYQVKAWLDDRSMASRAKTQELVAGANRIELLLEPRPVITGRFVPRDEGSRGRVDIHLVEAPKGHAVEADLLRASEKTRAESPQYTFRFEERPAGTYAVAAFAGGAILSEIAHVRLEQTPHEIELRELAVQELKLLHVIVEVPAGVEAGRIDVRSGAFVNTTELNELRFTQRTEDVGYLVPEPTVPPPPSEVRSYVVVSCALGTETVFYERSPGAVVRVAFGAPAQLSIELRGFDPQELYRLVAQLRPAEEKGAWVGRGPDPDPQPTEPLRELGPVQPGTYELAISLLGKSSRDFIQWWPIATRRIELAPGANRLAIDRPALHPLVVQLPANDVSYSVRLFFPDELGRLAPLESPDAERRVHFERLPAGRYRVSAQARGAAQAVLLDVDVPSAQPVTVPP